MNLLRHFLHAWRCHHLHLWRGDGYLNFDLFFVELTLAQHLAKFLPGGVVGRLQVVEINGVWWWQQRVEHALFCRVVRFFAHRLHRLFAGLFDRDFNQVTNDRIHITSNVAHLGELGRFNLYKRRVGQFGQSSRNLGFADTGRPDH